MTTVNSSSNEGKKAATTIKEVKVGIPRGLLYYKYAPLWDAFLHNLGCKVVYSPPTTDKIVREGSKSAVSELCVPMKTYFGHVKALVNENSDLDYLFVPRYVATKKNQFFCPKFMILPEVVKYRLKVNVPILTLEADSSKRQGIESAINFAKKLGIQSQKEAGKAWYFAIQKFKQHKKRMRSGSDVVELLDNLDKDKKHQRSPMKIRSRIPEQSRGKFPLNIMVVGHAYNVYEEHINMGLIHRLEEFDCNVMTLEKLPKEVFEKRILINKQYMNYWENEEEILQTARYYISQSEQEMDGIIFLISFACGPDSLVQELLMRDIKKRKIPYLDLVLDEHSGRAGLNTRIESFVDMIRRRKYGLGD